MQWSEVFDKYFIIRGKTDGDVLVFIPDSYTGKSIKYAWTTVQAVEEGLDYSSLDPIHYSLYLDEAIAPGKQFDNWKPMKTISQQERVCNKIRVMEERWKKFQTNKNKPKVQDFWVNLETTPVFTQQYVTIDYSL